MLKKLFVVFEIVLPLIIAGLIYLFFRSTDTVAFIIFDFIGLGDLIVDIKPLLQSYALPPWFIYSLPGGLWLLAFQNSLSYVFSFKYKYLYRLIVCASLSGIGLEVLQYLQITDGKFDWLDVLFYLIATALAFLNIFLIKNKWQLYSSTEQSPKMRSLVFYIFVGIIYLADVV